MKSMTGFGRSSNRATSGVSGKTPAKPTAASKAKSALAQNSVPELDISIRAVNGRYLEMRFHLPREYAGLESEFKAQLAKIFSRGTLDIYVNRAATKQTAEVAVNGPLANEYLTAYRKLGKETKLKAAPTLDWLTRIPDILSVREHTELTDAESKAARTLLQEAADACDSERIREGKALASELERHLASLETISKQVEELKTEANSELEKRFRDRLSAGLQKFGVGGQVDEQRLAQEIVIQLDRTDISEELQRLKEHIKAYRQLLKNEEPQGKKLDFYAQELLREVNTIGSKSHIAKLTGLVVEAKTLVERIREQVQNAE